MSAQFSIELQLLLKGVHWQLNKSIEGSYLDGVANLESLTFDESLLFKLAVWHNLLPWFFPFAKALSIGSKELRSKMVKQLLKDGINNQLQTLELVKISSLLSQKKIQHVILKGATIQNRFYSGFVDSRSSDDIDILIKGDELTLATQVLGSVGYKSKELVNISKLTSFIEKYESWYRWRDIGFQKESLANDSVDLHWRLADPFTIPVETEELLTQASSLIINDEVIPSLSFAALFVHVCVHGYIDYFFRLRYLVDVYSAMNQTEFNLEDALSVAEKWGVTDKVLASIATAHYFFEPHSMSNVHPYAKFVSQRFIDAQGKPIRSHQNHAKWSAKDKRQHLINQIKFRSKKSSFFAPIVARMKYNKAMVEQWPLKMSAAAWYPIAFLRRLIQ